MTNALREELIETTKRLIAIPHTCADLKVIGQKWIDAVGTENEKAVAKDYVAELEEDVMPIDDLIAALKTEGGKKFFGEELAAKMLAHAEKGKAKGAIYCDCAACKEGAAVLAHKAELLG